MADKNFLTPAEIAAVTVKTAQSKVALPVWKMLLMGILAGAYIAFAGFASNMGAFNLMSNPNTFGLGRAVCGVIFSGGLIMVVLCGAELFTGNCLILTGVLDKKVKITAMLKSWVCVYIGNLIGSILIAWLCTYTGLLGCGADQLGGMTIKIAATKAGLDFSKAFVLGILCNWLVCLAVWMSTGAKDVAGKIMAIFFPIWLFVTAGFEHSIANMFYIPAGIFAKATPEYVDAALSMGVSQNAIDSLGWGSFFGGNLLPVTLGNMVGGCVFVALFYWLIYIKKSKKELK